MYENRDGTMYAHRHKDRDGTCIRVSELTTVQITNLHAVSIFCRLACVRDYSSVTLQMIKHVTHHIWNEHSGDPFFLRRAICWWAAIHFFGHSLKRLLSKHSLSDNGVFRKFPASIFLFIRRTVSLDFLKSV